MSGRKLPLILIILFVQVFTCGCNYGKTDWARLLCILLYVAATLWWILRCGCVIYYIYNIYVQFLRKISFIAAPHRGLSAVYILYLYYIYKLFVEVTAAKSLLRAAQCSWRCLLLGGMKEKAYVNKLCE